MILHSIMVDDREKTPSPQRTVDMLNGLGAQANIRHLDVGDFRWTIEDVEARKYHNVIVERKSIADFLASVPPDDRLTQFIEKTGNLTPPENQIRALLLEGDQFQLRNYGTRNWTPETLDDMLVSLQFHGLVILHSADWTQTPARLAAFWRWTGRDDHRTFLTPTLPVTQQLYFDREQKDAVRMLMCMPGWGEAKSYSALAEFGSLNKVLDALDDEKSMLRVKGVGRGLVQKGRSFLDRRVF